MPFESALNLVWLILGAIALGTTMRARFRGGSPHNYAPAWLHVCGVALIVAALFPYISATDDVLRIQHMNVQHSHSHEHQSKKKSSSDQLIRLYETMDTPVVVTVRQISLVFFFVSLVVAPVTKLINRSTPLASGRSPPLLATT